mmetsp:Transcript_8608/g.13644  ORF Transcript_8608/g.13644 Transcript_8608/m.13644 type:complete len:292 (+) Transcript_8608:1287-2162(+)
MQMGLLADAHSKILVHDLLVQPEQVQTFPLCGLVPAEPLDELRLLGLRHVVYVGHNWRMLLIRPNNQHLPVRFPVIDERKNANHPYSHDLAHRAGLRVHLQHVYGIVVSADTCIWMLQFWMLPGLGNGSVVDQGAHLRVVLVIAQLALLCVLDDGIVLVLLVHLHFGICANWNFANKVQQLLSIWSNTSLKWNLMPWRNLLPGIGYEALVAQSVLLALVGGAELGQVERGQTWPIAGHGRRYVKALANFSVARRRKPRRNIADHKGQHVELPHLALNSLGRDERSSGGGDL